MQHAKMPQIHGKTHLSCLTFQSTAVVRFKYQNLIIMHEEAKNRDFLPLNVVWKFSLSNDMWR